MVTQQELIEAKEQELEKFNRIQKENPGPSVAIRIARVSRELSALRQGFSQDQARTLGAQAERSGFRSQKLIRLQRQGIDTDALRRGQLNLQNLSQAQLEALQREGLVETQTQQPELSAGEQFVGTGAKGGLLVKTASGEVVERFQTPRTVQTFQLIANTGGGLFTRTGEQIGSAPKQTVVQGTRGQTIVQSPTQTPTTFLSERQVDSFRPSGSTRDVPVTEVVVTDAEGNIIRKATSQEVQQFRQGTRVLTTPTSKPSDFFAGIQQEIQRTQTRIETREGRGRGTFITGATSFGLGAAASVTGTVRAITKPKETLTSAFEFTRNIVSDPEILKLSGKKIGQKAAISPSFVTGFAAAEIATFKLPILVVKGTDIVRVRGLKKVATEKIVAPEFFKGQTFPTIKKGQTAGELLKEFKASELRGFTATPKPFKKTTKAGKGTSELPGVFQAPKLSPRFLRVSSEETKLFKFGFKQTFRPTAIKIKPTSFELSPLVKPGQRSLAPLKPTQEFFKKAPKGKSIIPFIKEEKEAVIPFETPLEFTKKSAFFKFEGRKIPVFEFEAKGVKGTGLGIKDLPTAKDISKRLSSSRVGKRAVFGLEDVGFATTRPSGRKISQPEKSLSSFSKSTSKSLSSSAKTSSSSKIVSRVRSPVRSRVSSKISSFVKRLLSSRGKPSRRRILPPPSSASGFSSLKRLLRPRRKPLRRRRTARGRRKKKKKGTFRDDLLITPGFTAKTLKITKRLRTGEDILKEATRTDVGIRAIPVLNKKGGGNILNAIP